MTATGGTQASAESRFQEIVAAQNVEQATIEISPDVDSATVPGTLITVTVTAPASINSYAPAWYYEDASLTAAVRMIKQ